MNAPIKTQLLQRTRFRGTRSFTLHDDGVLNMMYNWRGQLREIALHVSCLATHPEQHSHKSIRGRAAILFVFAMGLSFSAMLCFAGPMSQMWMAHLVIAIVMCLNVFIYLFVRVRYDYDLIVFRSNEDSDNVALLNGVPSAQAVASFVEILGRVIRSHQAAPNLSGATLTQRMQQLASLRDQGVLTEDEFSKAKQAAITQYPYR